ncbi:MAG: TonB-dependent receptor, partial [Flavobacteriaceae bacterium]|nr:TonB-dependent receptor [Flavobacteriaceae bacterium]
MKLLFTLLMSFLALGIFSQQTNGSFKITGTIRDADTNSPLQFITISLQDIYSQEIIGDITSKDGTFEIDAPKSKYYCLIESLSFKTHVIQLLNVDKEIDLGTITLTQNVEKLDEVEVIARTKLLNFKFGKKIYNASKDIANIGGNAITVLENTPTVRVDDQGTITIRGNKATVFVNGKPYGGFKSNADILSLIPASTIGTVEIINQSAKYDAEGGGGILNIVLKRRADDGYNGSVEIHAGKPDNDGVSGFVNYKTNKINIFSTASFNHNVINKDTDIQQTFLNQNNEPTGNFEEERNDYRQRNSVLFNIGTDLYLNEKNTVTTSLLYSNTDKNYDSDLFLNDFMPIDALINTSSRNVDDNSDEAFIEAFISYTTKFTNEGHQLSVNFNYDKNSSDNNTFILNEQTYPISDQYNQKYTKDEFADNYFIQADYTLPLQNNAKLEVGLKSNFRIYENDFAAQHFNKTTLKYEPILAYTNNINYDENTHAYYVSYAGEYNKYSYAIGLRSEITQIKISEDLKEAVFKDDYTDYFPTAELSYNFSSGNYLSASYTTYIDRPTISQLNPFNSFTDERFILIGNPYLKPSYSNYFNLEYYLESEKISLNTAFFHSNTTKNILDILEKTGDQTADGFDIYRRIPVNNGTFNQTGLDFVLNYFPINKLRLNASFTPFYADLSETREAAYDYNDFRWYARLSGSYSFLNSLKLKLDYTYQSPVKTAITEFETYQYANLTASKDFFDGKATLSFRIADIFNGRKGVYNS